MQAAGSKLLRQADQQCTTALVCALQQSCRHKCVSALDPTQLAMNMQDDHVREAIVWHALFMSLDNSKAKSERICSLLMQGMRTVHVCSTAAALQKHVAAIRTCCRLWRAL